MDKNPGPSLDRRAMPYLSLLFVQTIAATTLFWTIFPVFQSLLSDAGQPQSVGGAVIVISFAGALIIQLAYWYRYLRVRVWVPLHNPAVGHVLLFASRASFFFGGALFSAVFFRHVPQLESLPPYWVAAAKALSFLFVLFSLFCYALELERLGRAIERPE